MALIDKASLLMVPSTYEDDTLYNVLPSGNKAPDETGSHNGYDQTRADFTFSRGSNLAATRRNSSGLIEKGRENLLLQSNQFDTTWVSNNVTETSGQEGYDGTNDAWLVTKSSAVAYVNLYQAVSLSGVQTFSVYAKAGTLNKFGILAVGGTDPFVDVDLSTGAITGSRSSVIDKKIEDIGNGWYRVSVVFNETTTGVHIYPDWNQTNTGNLYIQDAQLEAGLVATDYIETGSSTAQAGILEDMPRINYDANGENGALLLEPSRTNLLPHSEYFGASDWVKLSTSVTTNEITSPEGIVNASKITTTSGGGASNVNDVIYKSANTDYTFSVFVKAGNVNRVLIGQQMTGLYSNNIYDLSTNTWVLVDSNSPTLDAQDFGNGWYRLSMTENSGASASNYQSWVGPIDDDGTAFNSTTTGNYIYTFGAQLEAGSYSSSIIPTHGAAVTRGADDCEKASIGDVVGINDLSFLIEATPLMESNSSNPPIFLTLTNNNGQTNICYLQMRDNGVLRFDYYVGGVQQFRITSNTNVIDYDTTFKAAVAVKNNDCVLYVNGTQIGTDTSGSTTNLFNQINCGTYVTDAYTGSSIKQLAIFNERLSNSELADLTA
jgi:hypothetical protein